MAEAMSFVLRNAPDEQLERGMHAIDYFRFLYFLSLFFCSIHAIFN